MSYVASSILTADFAHLGAEVDRVSQLGIKILHLDVMDGAFVPNLSFGPPVIASLRKRTNLFFDVHLMVYEPMRIIDSCIKAGADNITIHYESCNNPRAVLSYIRSKHVNAGIAISPETPVEVLLPVLDQVNLALVMTVHPGRGGQPFMAGMMEKVERLRAAKEARKLNLDIEVDGGVNPQTAEIAHQAGANLFVVGSAITNSKKPKAVLTQIEKAIAD
ncbi:MAG: ribulose-phosphate 3-epimerase [Clostridia bacterium]|nr:ribulose-phosphate 3-epimerase [Clostridia bacterium]